MAEEPSRIRDRIEATRAELTRDVDRLADKTSPRRVAQRRWTAVKERVMGVSHSAQDSTGSMVDTARDRAGSAVDTVQEKAYGAKARVGQTAQEVAGTVRQAPAALARQTQGNPLAVGVIAFGVGLLSASLIPETELERRAGRQIKDRAGDLVEPIREPLAESAQQLKSDLGGAAREAAQEVKQTANEAATATKEQSRESAQNAATETRSVTQHATRS
jgi:gas vesicle protein